VLFSVIINAILIYSFESINPYYYLEVFSNLLIALLVGFLLFYFDIWSEGDGKLFFAYCALLPLSVYDKSYLPYFPGFALLVNIFTPPLMYFAASALMKPKSFFRSIMKDGADKSIIDNVLRLFSVNWAVHLALSQISISSPFLMQALTIIVYRIGFSYIKEKNKSMVRNASVILGALRLMIDKNVYSASFLLSFAIMILIYHVVFSSFIKHVLEKTSIENLSAGSLREGMRVSKSIIMKRGKLIISDDDDNGEDVFIRKDSLLDKEKILVLEKNTSVIVPVYKKIPFAPLMLLGALITILVKGNILILLINLFS